jgi:hypothetical protein
LLLFFRYLSLYWRGNARKGIHCDKLGMRVFVAVAGMLIVAQVGVSAAVSSSDCPFLPFLRR